VAVLLDLLAGGVEEEPPKGRVATITPNTTRTATTVASTGHQRCRDIPELRGRFRLLVRDSGATRTGPSAILSSVKSAGTGALS
jgi:hypothetical protein